MESSTSNGTPPNGGFTAWSKVIGCFMIYFNTWGLSTSFGVYQSHYQLHTLKSYSSSTISWVGTIQVFLLFFISIWSGALFDRGYGRYLFYTGCLLMVFGNFMLSLSSAYYQIFLSQSLCIGVGSGMVFVPAVATVATAFTTKLSIANGIATTGSAVGGTVLPIAFEQLVPRVGLAWTNRIFGFAILTTSLLAIFLLKPPKEKPARLGPTNTDETELVGGGDFALSTPQATRGGQQRSSGILSYFNMSPFRERPYAFLCAGLFLVELGFWIPPFTITPYAQLYLGTSADYAFYLLAILNAGSFAGRIIPALIAQNRHIGPAWTLVAGCVSLGILVLCWLAVFDVIGITVWAVFTGFMSGIAVSMPNTVVTSLSAIHQTGARSGLLWTVVAFAALVGAPIAGLLVDTKTNSYRWGQLFSALSICVGSVLLCVPAVHIMRKRSD